MTEAIDNYDLTRVGPGTVMGEFMRQYWIPAAMSSEVEPDGAPLRLKLLGEKLIAFRDTSGRVGVMDHRCPHRCASLFLGRNEEDGLRCIYHGWKFDVDGNCVDMPSVPAHQDFKDKVHAKAYKTHERAGLIWVYMGAKETMPEMPQLEATLLPESQIQLSFMQRSCNWLQALEGDIDTSHVGFLHAGSVDIDDFEEGHPMRHTVVNRAPEFAVANTDWGTMYGAYRQDDNGMMSWRIAHFSYPFWTHTPNLKFKSRVIAKAWVPLDDEHVMLVSISGGQDEGQLLGLPLKNGQHLRGFGPLVRLPNTTDWLGRFRPRPNAENDYLIDRDAQRRNLIYSGIETINGQDQAVTESMGTITDHSFEHLAPSDQMIARTRRRLLRAARAYAERSVVPPGVDDPDVYMQARSGNFIVDEAVDWQDAYREQVQNAVRPVAALTGK